MIHNARRLLVRITQVGVIALLGCVTLSSATSSQDDPCSNVPESEKNLVRKEFELRIQEYGEGVVDLFQWGFEDADGKWVAHGKGVVKQEGNILEERWLHRDILHGPTTLYHRNGKVKSVVEYVDGSRIGVSRVWNDKGVLIVDENYYEDRRHGSHLRYYDNGQMKLRLAYTNGKINGLLEGWHDNGVMSVKGTYAQGKKRGTWTEWDADGNIKSIVEYGDN